MVELVRAGRDPENLSREFEPTAQSIRNWVAEADRQEGRREPKADALGQGLGCPRTLSGSGLLAAAVP
jgi:transposase